MSRVLPSHTSSIAGRRMRALREELGWSQEKLGVAIGIDESSSRARISRYELGVHEPPAPTAKRIADALGVPLMYLHCDDDNLAALLLELHRLPASDREEIVRQFRAELASWIYSRP